MTPSPNQTSGSIMRVTQRHTGAWPESRHKPRDGAGNAKSATNQK